MAITEGSLVQLKSGSPCMTVKRVYSPPNGPLAGVQLAECQWFDGTKPMEQAFPIKSLDIVDIEEGPTEPQF
ncbi:MAG: DUF2158 domain-containing protein [Geobacteraceae bacterium]|nr:DUF2158 domain-containing protein [Geobacteraceae bacterium]